ncbi:hypothetical protein Plhal304r1_c071g0159711 [Plasmopara halstedii]
MCRNEQAGIEASEVDNAWESLQVYGGKEANSRRSYFWLIFHSADFCYQGMIITSRRISISEKDINPEIHELHSLEWESRIDFMYFLIMV